MVIDYAIENTKASDKVDNDRRKDGIGSFANLCIYIQENLRKMVLKIETTYTEEGIKNFKEILETRKFKNQIDKNCERS